MDFGPRALENVVRGAAAPAATFWAGRRVLVTGTTGFKGGWLLIWLRRLGADVTGLGLSPEGTALFNVANLSGDGDNRILDIRAADALSALIESVRPEIVFHLAAQPLVRASYRCPVETFATNVMGTVNLLEACRSVEEIKTIVAITTDKVYANEEHGLPYREGDALGGHDPYSASKAACEIAIQSYRDSYFRHRGVGVATARAGNVIGGGDWSEDRLLPDAVRAWSQGAPLSIRRPDAVRPWQHVLEPLAGYLVLAERLCAEPRLAGAFNMGPHTHEAADVRTVVDLARASFGRGEVHYGIADGPHEAGLLTLETTKARTVLDLSPRWDLKHSVARTMDWYARWYRGEDARKLCDADIDAWESAAL